MEAILTILFWLFIGLPFVAMVGMILYAIFMGIMAVIASPLIWFIGLFVEEKERLTDED